MRASKKAGDPDNFTAYVHRIMESLWLLAVIASALAVSPADWMLSYIQMPKVVLLRILVSLMVILWVLEWAISSKSSVLPRPILTWTTLKLWASLEPTRWLTIAVGVFLATYVLSTLLSSSFRISVWGRSAGEDGYSLYNMLTYFLLFLVVATHLRSKPQLWRLLIVIACVGAITSGIGVLQRLGIDALALGTDPLNRIGATFGNSIFMGAFVKGGEKVYHCGGGIVYHRHDEKGLNWEPDGIRSGAGVRSSGVSQESTGSSDTWEAALCRLCLRR